MAAKRRVLVVDGYNVIRESPAYRPLIDEDLADPVLHDVYIRAREALLADVAAFAQGAYEATVVFDGFGNPDPERPPLRTAGVDVVFSPSGVEADAMNDHIAELRCSPVRQGPVRATVAERVSPDVRLALRAMTLPPPNRSARKKR